jgi:hypothetical protein
MVRASVPEAKTGDQPPVCPGLLPLKTTGGSSWRRDRWPGKASAMGWWVSKSLLCSLMQSLLQSGRLRFNPALPLADKLRDELGRFQVKISEQGNESYGAWRGEG